MESAIPFPVHNDDGCPDDESIVFDITSEEFCTDEFRMYEFKVRRCPKTKPHDWTQCPFAHCGERATRRDPRLFNYSGAACGEFRRTGSCSRGDLCPYAHGVFECWLHPSKYKTQMCSDVKNCKRPVCFFAHSPQELRTPTNAALPKGGLHIQSAKSCHRDLPPLKQMVSPVNVEAIAAEVERRLGQKSGPPLHNAFLNSTSPPQNAISSFLNSVVHLQQAVPGINISQLLQAVGGSQLPCHQVDPNTMHGLPNAVQQMDLKTLAQAQMQLNLQNQVQNFQAQAQAQMASEIARHQSWPGNRSIQCSLSMDSNSAPLSGPLGSLDSAYSPRTTSLNAFSGPFSSRNSTSSAGSLPIMHNTALNQSQIPSSSGLATGITSSGFCGQHIRNDIGVEWAAIDNEVPGQRSGGSDRSTTVAENQQTDAPDTGIWGCEEWLPYSECRQYCAGQLTSKQNVFADRENDALGLKSMDPLLDALPRDLTDMSGSVSNT